MNDLVPYIGCLGLGMAGGVALWTPIYLHLKRQIPDRDTTGRFVSKSEKAAKRARLRELREYNSRHAA